MACASAPTPLPVTVWLPSIVKLAVGGTVSLYLDALHELLGAPEGVQVPENRALLARFGQANRDGTKLLVCIGERLTRHGRAPARLASRQEQLGLPHLVDRRAARVRLRERVFALV